MTFLTSKSLTTLASKKFNVDCGLMSMIHRYEAPLHVKLDYANKEMKASAPNTYFLEVHHKHSYEASDNYLIRPVYGCTSKQFIEAYTTRDGELWYITGGAIMTSANAYDKKLTVTKEEFLVNASLQGINPEIEFIYDEDWKEIDCRIINGESLLEKRKAAFGKDCKDGNLTW